MNLSDIFESSFLEGYASADITGYKAVICLMLCAAFGLYIFLAYRVLTRKSFFDKNFVISLPVIAVITGAIILTVQSNIVISLGMVGALSIVRFRTAIKDPIDTVYMFWAVGEGLALGAGFVDVGLIGALVIGVIMVIITSVKGSSTMPYLLILHFDDRASQQIKGLIRQLPKAHIKSKTVQHDGIELTIELRIRESDTDFVDKFLRVPGVFDATLVAHQGDLLS